MRSPALKSRICAKGFGFAALTLWAPPRGSKALRRVSAAINALIMLLWLPLAATGAVLMPDNLARLSGGRLECAVGTLVGLIIGLLVHEAAHAAAALAYGGEVYEFGVALKYFVIPCAYAAIDTDGIKSRLRRVQVYMAGIEADLALFGLTAVLSATMLTASDVLMYASACCASLAAINMTFVNEQLDGFRVLELLIGADDLAESVNEPLGTDFRYKSEERTLTAALKAAVSVILRVAKAAFPLIVIMNIAGVVMICV